MFGYPDSPSRPDNGANSRLIARGAVGGGLIQLDADGDTAIRTQAGFSGSPVVITDEAGDAVIGMLAAASRDGSGRDAYAVPVAALAEGWPDVVGALSLPPCPYKGLSPFTADDAARSLYVGREDDVAKLRRMLMRHGLVIVAGSSGVGKSSLIAAGLRHSLESDGWSVASVRPGATPTASLAKALAEADPEGQHAGIDALDSYLRRLRTEGLTSTGVKLVVSAGRPLLVCIDPLEEVLDDGCAEEARAEFLQLLFSLRPVQGHDFRLVCALRADFISRLLDYPEAGRRLSGQVHMLSPLGRDALQRIIEEPAQELGVRYESRPGAPDSQGRGRRGQPAAARMGTIRNVAPPARTGDHALRLPADRRRHRSAYPARREGLPTAHRAARIRPGRGQEHASGPRAHRPAADPAGGTVRGLHPAAEGGGQRPHQGEAPHLPW